MRVLVRAFAKFREIAGEEACFDLKEGSTIGDLLKAISLTHPELEGDLFRSDGTVGEGVTILRNRKGLDHSDLRKTVLEEGDEVAFLPPFSGG
ncbi:MAG TPA: MoaD/ThiS family protein [Methanothrix sp.]|nr:MoaD/ThiS family protein [Methanothrix sp.]HPJ83224.1 MoaD/ThiS family protein [Methanothrix sp.]HPR66786.1 MoaD/ThiS family protein [Methanothrix sp.]